MSTFFLCKIQKQSEIKHSDESSVLDFQSVEILLILCFDSDTYNAPNYIDKYKI